MEQSVQTKALQLVAANYAIKNRVVPESINNGKLICFVDTSNVENQKLSNALKLLTGYKILLKGINYDELDYLLQKHYSRARRNNRIDKLNFNVFESKSESIVNNIIEQAWNYNASDIHFEPTENEGKIRFRIDGKLHTQYLLSQRNYKALLNKVKIFSGLDIAETRLPQDGRLLFDENGVKFDLRVSTIPSMHGEKVVLRLLTREKSLLELDNLGFNEKDLTLIRNTSKKQQGLILLSGPTGSGKTTTLYAILNEINSTQINIVTVEEPVEYSLNGINQTQVKISIGLDYPTVLRSFLRQDPDVIMVGEIRDEDTARISIRSALTGHLVLSTIHTNSAIGIVNRLIDLGIKDYLVADVMRLAVAQRLVRKLCVCKSKNTVNKSERVITSNLYNAVGCDKCNYTGYYGRIAIYEIVPINKSVVEMVQNSALTEKQIMKKLGIETLNDKAHKLVEKGLTTIEEVATILTDI